MKKDLEEYEKELETMWELYNTACEELQEKGYEMMKNGKMDVLLDFIEKKNGKDKSISVSLNTMTEIGFTCFIAGLEMGKRKQNKPDGGKKKETEKCVK